jgi:hypothetical protein
MMNRAAVLEKTITLFQWSPESLRQVEALACGAEGFADAMKALEAALERTPKDTPDPQVAESLAEPLRGLYATAAASAPLDRLFQASPRFSAMPPADVAAAACLAGIRPDPRDLLTTRDGAFLRVFSQVAGGAEVTAEKVLLEDLAWLFELAAQAPDGMKRAVAAARAAGPGAAWTEQVLAVERALEQGDAGGSGPAELSPEAMALLDWARKNQPSPPQKSPLLGTPRLSMLLREEVLAFDALPPAERLLAGAPTPPPPPGTPDEARVLAERALAHVPAGEAADPRPRLDFRVWAAGHFIQLRKFAKLDALFRGWPELGQRLYADRTSITALEAQLISPQPMTDDVQRLWNDHAADSRLMALLALRPLFLHISRDELRNYMLVSQSMAPDTDTPYFTAAPVTAAPQPVPSPSAPSADAVAPQAVVQDPLDFLDVMLEVEELAEPGECRVVLTADGSAVEGRTQMDFGQAVELGASAAATLREEPPPEEGARQTAARPAGGRSGPEEMLGRNLFERLLPEPVRERLLELLKAPRGVRILWSAERASHVARLSLEALFVPRMRMFPALTRRHSVVRFLQPGTPCTLRPAVPLRVLAVFSNPDNRRWLNVGAEAEAVRKALEPAIREGRVVLQVLRDEEANRERLQEAVRSFQPHVFHFVGHGQYMNDRDKGALMLHSSTGPVMVPDTEVVTLLHDYGIQLALLNGCDTGRTSPKDAISGIAGLLVHRGIPAVIATVRPVTDDAAILFSREFYRTFADGHSLENSVTEARKALSVEQQDWLAYALYVGTTNLHDIRVPSGAGSFRAP